MDKISVIVPCYNEEEVLPIFHQEVTKELRKIENIDMRSFLLMMEVMIEQFNY